MVLEGARACPKQIRWPADSSGCRTKPLDRLHILRPGAGRRLGLVSQKPVSLTGSEGWGVGGGFAACCYMPERKCVRKFPLSRSPSAVLSVSVSPSCPCVVFLAGRRQRGEPTGATSVDALSGFTSFTRFAYLCETGRRQKGVFFSFFNLWLYSFGN